MKGAFAAYYKRKIEEGKHSLIAINGKRNNWPLPLQLSSKTTNPIMKPISVNIDFEKP